MVATNTMIALYDLDETDKDILTQVFEKHPDRLRLETVETIENLTPNNYGLCLSHTEIEGSKIPVMLLPSRRVRAGIILDDIESYILQNHYGDIDYNGYTLHWDKSLLTFNKQDILLTERERSLIAEIISGGAQGRSRDYLLNKIWGYRADLETHTLETHIYRLRQKIEEEPDMPKRLVTIEGGYKLVD